MSQNNTAQKHSVLLDVQHLKTQFQTDDGIVHAVEDVSFQLYKGETLGIVGESGSGKSVTALSVMRLVTGKIAGGKVLFEGTDLLSLNERRMRSIRGNEIAMIFQDPMTSLDPVYTIGFQMEEAILKHNRMSRKQARELALKTLVKVGIPQPELRIKDYPHQLSGGQRQRVMIAIGLSCMPKLLIADEPTTALDVTIQAQILELMRDLKKESDMSILMITHDLGIVAGMCDRVAVMYCGRIVEIGNAHDIFYNPQHKYTEGLLRSIPRMDRQADHLNTIPGSVPNLLTVPQGCAFCNRCTYATERCRQQQPPMVNVSEGHYAACHLALAEKGSDK